MLWSILFLSGGRGKPSPGPRRLPALIHSHLFFISSKAQCSFLSRGLCTCCPLCLCSLPSHPQPLHSTSTLTSAFSPDGHPNATSSGKCLLSLGVGGGGLGTQLCPTLCDPMGCSPPGSSVHRTSQARILEWVAISFYNEILLSNEKGWPLKYTTAWNNLRIIVLGERKNQRSAHTTYDSIYIKLEIQAN